LNASYEAWNEVLAERFFRPDCAGRPVYLSVDDEELEELASRVGAGAEVAAESLVKAVRREFTSSPSYGLYGEFFRSTTTWRRGGSQGPPPCIAMLSVAVLAGSRMARDPQAGVASHNYYRRYNELVGYPPDSGQPAGFEELRRLWMDLDRWLKEDRDGTLGISTVPESPAPAHVGYPISQCLLRESDRRRLTEFFRSVGLEPGDEITATELFSYLRNWARPGCGLSDPAVRVIAGASSDVAEEIGKIAHAELAGWRGEILDEHGRHRGELSLVLELKQGGHWVKAAFWAKRPDGFPAKVEIRTRSGDAIGLSAVSDNWYGPTALPVRNKDLDDGLVLEGAEYSFAYRSSGVVPLRASDELGRWVSVPQVVAAEPHCLIVRTTLMDPVKQFLADHAEPGWRETSGSGNVPDGWHVLDSVKITSTASPSEPYLRPLAPRFGTASSFEGGLRVRGSQYLLGGEPDLWITVAPGDEPEVTVDGEPVSLSGPISQIKLSQYGLGAGNHCVAIGGLTRYFTTFSGVEVAAPTGSGSLAHILRKGAGYVPLGAGPQEVPAGPQPRGTVHIAGASAIADPDDLPEPPTPPVLLPAGFREYAVLGRRPGEILEAPQPTKPAWLRRIGIEDQFQYFDQPLTFEAQWLITSGSSGAQVRPIRRPPLPPLPADTPDPSRVEKWCNAIARGMAAHCEPSDRTPLNEYVEFAEKLGTVA
jgi:hypothetical protein